MLLLPCANHKLHITTARLTLQHTHSDVPLGCVKPAGEGPDAQDAEHNEGHETNGTVDAQGRGQRLASDRCCWGGEGGVVTVSRRGVCVNNGRCVNISLTAPPCGQLVGMNDGQQQGQHAPLEHKQP